MNPKLPAPHGVHFGRVAAMVSVTDLARALQFYCGVLGFQKVFENGDPAGFVILEKETAELHLNLDRQHRASAQNVAHLMVSDATALYDHLVAQQTHIVKGLRDADFGLRCFVLADPDGNRIDLGQAL